MARRLIVDVSMVYAANKAKLGHLKRKDGYPTGAVFGFIRMIEAAKKEHVCDEVVLCFDVGGTSRRREIDPSYKSNREGNTVAWMEEGHEQLIVDWAFASGYIAAWAEGYEADDIIANACYALKDEDTAVILSRDHDMHAFLSQGKIEQVWPKTEKWTELRFREVHGVSPSCYEEHLAWKGDSSDTVKPATSAEEYERNMLLVKKGTPDGTHHFNHPQSRDVEELRELYTRLEFNSLLKKLDQE